MRRKLLTRRIFPTYKSVAGNGDIMAGIDEFACITAAVKDQDEALLEPGRVA
jgi:hypothetical protein